MTLHLLLKKTRLLLALSLYNRIYNIQGQYVGTRSELSTLPKGIYIINGKKIVR